MPVAGVNPNTERLTSWRLTHRKNEMVIERVFHGFGTVGQVFAGAPLADLSVPIPRVGEAIPPNAFSAQANANAELLGLGERWFDRLRVLEVRIVPDPRDTTVNDVVVSYSTRAPADPQAPEVRINIVSETFMIRWDEHGNLLAPGFEGGVPVEVPGLELSWTQSLDNFVGVIDEIVENIGHTNSFAWSVFGNALAGDDGEIGDMHQWVFLGADAFKSGELNWRPTFRFRWLPPIPVQIWSAPKIPGDSGANDKSTHDIASRRGMFYYWYNQRADGSIDTRPGASPVPSSTGIPLRGLQQKAIRREFDFNMFFSDDRFDVPDRGAA